MPVVAVYEARKFLWMKQRKKNSQIFFMCWKSKKIIHDSPINFFKVEFLMEMQIDVRKFIREEDFFWRQIKLTQKPENLMKTKNHQQRNKYKIHSHNQSLKIAYNNKQTQNSNNEKLIFIIYWLWKSVIYNLKNLRHFKFLSKAHYNNCRILSGNSAVNYYKQPCEERATTNCWWIISHFLSFAELGLWLQGNYMGACEENGAG